MKSSFYFFSTMESHAWGGSEMLWSQTSKRLAEQGHRVTASTKSWNPPPNNLKVLRDCGVRTVERKPVRQNRIEQLYRRVANRPQKNEELLFRRELDRVRPNLIVFSHGGLVKHPKLAHLCHEVKIPYVFVVQANWEAWWPRDNNLKDVQYAFAHAEKCYFVSTSNRELAEKQLALKLSNSEVIRNPYSVPFECCTQWPDTDNDSFSLACVARLEPTAKGQDLLFEVLSKDRWRRRNLRVSCYGDGPMKQSLRELVDFFGVSDSVTFRGVSADISQIWNSHHALIMPSRYEGLPLALVEAALCNRISIVTNVAGNNELVEDGKTGFLAPYPSVADLDDTLERAWRCRERWQQMGSAAGKWARGIIPRDPIQVFCERLVELADNRQ